MTTRPATRRKCGLHTSEDGATAVEAALVLSIFVGMVLTIIDFAEAFYIWNALQLVVGQASRYVMVQSSCDATCAENVLQGVLQRAISSANASICTMPTAGQYCVNASCNANTCTLSALYGFNFIGTYTLGGQITVPTDLPRY